MRKLGIFLASILFSAAVSSAQVDYSHIQVYDGGHYLGSINIVNSPILTTVETRNHYTGEVINFEITNFNYRSPYFRSPFISYEGNSEGSDYLPSIDKVNEVDDLYR